MKILKYSVLQNMSLSKLENIAGLFLVANLLLLNQKCGLANTDVGVLLASSQEDKTIEGISGGATDSHGCGFIANSPSYKMNLAKRIDYMRLTVEVSGGQPTLLVVGPNSDDSFCILGDGVSGLKPEISGVWEAGNYQIYVGDRTTEQHKFVLNISTNN